MRDLRVLMVARPDLEAYPGGDTTQVLETARALRRLGVQITLNPDRITYRDYDLIHFFNVIDPEDIIGHVRRSGLPYVLSTIYCLYDEYDRFHRRDWVGRLARWLPRHSTEYLKTVGKWLLLGERWSSYDFLWRGHAGSIRYILTRAGCLLPNSESEYRRLVADFGIEKDYLVVPNGVDLRHFQQAPKRKRDLVLCVARIEGRKNQLNLIKAMNGVDLPLYIVGRPADNQQGYYRECREAAGSNVHFTGYVSDEELKELYARCKVHVLPSWFETTGLSSLESAAMGCNVVVTDRGDVTDYFADHAWYCDPGDPASIRAAVSDAFRSPWKPGLRALIKEKFNWERAAEVTLRAYSRVYKTNRI